MYDNDENVDVMSSAEEVLMSENALLEGLLEAANFKSDESNCRKVQIKRKGKVLFEFAVCPLSEADLKTCRKECTKMIPNPMGRHLPKIEGDTDYIKMRSWKIYLATVAEDRKKLWDNPVVKQRMNTLRGVEVIDECLMAGEKDAVCALIDDISGYNVNLDDYLKN